MQALGQRRGGGFTSARCVLAHADVKLDEGRAQGCFFRLFALRAQFGKGHFVGPRRIARFAQHGPQQIVEVLHQRVMRAKGEIEIDGEAIGRLNIRLHLPEDGHIRAAKFVDALFGIADDEEFAPPVSSLRSVLACEAISLSGSEIASSLSFDSAALRSGCAPRNDGS